MVIRKIILSALVAMFMAGGVFAQQQLRIGFVNSEAILEQYSGTRAAEEELRRQYARWEQEASQKEQNIRNMQDNLQRQALLLSEDRRNQIQRELQDSIMAYQRFLQEKFGQQGEAAQRNNELLRPIVERINRIINQIATEDNYDFIFDARAGIIFAKTSYDLTDRVIRVLNSGR